MPGCGVSVSSPRLLTCVGGVLVDGKNRVVVVVVVLVGGGRSVGGGWMDGWMDGCAKHTINHVSRSVRVDWIGIFWCLGTSWLRD